MRQQVLITDLTRMNGDHVCVAGVTSDGRSIRPCVQHGNLTESWLWDNGRLIVRPFALVELELVSHKPGPPHTEDWIIDAGHKVFLGLNGEAERQVALIQMRDASVETSFGAQLHFTESDNLREKCWI